MSGILVPISLISDRVRASIPVLARSRSIYSVELPRSLSRRLEFWAYAVDMWFSSPIIGEGIGSFAIMYFGTDQNLYPHNIFFEIAAESGTIGVALFALLILVGTAKLRSGWHETDKFLFSFLVYWFINAMFSLDMAGNRQLFMSIGMTLILHDRSLRYQEVGENMWNVIYTKIPSRFLKDED
jgi:O-antigen ligase